VLSGIIRKKYCELILFSSKIPHWLNSLEAQWEPVDRLSRNRESGGERQRLDLEGERQTEHNQNPTPLRDCIKSQKNVYILLIKLMYF
jgi:hypothetical protein